MSHEPGWIRETYAAAVARIIATPTLAGIRLPTTVPLASGPCGDWHQRLMADFGDPWAPKLGTRPSPSKVDENSITG